MKALYESVNYDKGHEKRSFFQYMEELIDKIYGVETEIVERAAKRFYMSKLCPKDFETRINTSKDRYRFEKLKNQLRNFKMEDQKEKDVGRAIFHTSPEK